MIGARWSATLGITLVSLFLLVGCDDEGVPTGNCGNLLRDGAETDVDCGGPSCGACLDGLECREAQDCRSGNCDEGVCRPEGVRCADGVQNGTESDVDCGGNYCDRCENGLGCEDDLDCLSENCFEGLCVAPTCFDDVQNGVETDVDCGGGECIGCDAGLGCREDVDCYSLSCDGRQCTATSCSDSVHNGDETDVDCGGDDGCPRCESGLLCDDESDCDSGVCEADADGTRCQAPTCDDEVQNSDETGVDCGGADTEGCRRCDAGEGCEAESDCSTGVCGSGGLCLGSTCDDDARNGTESDIDCGGDCEPCEDERTCIEGSDCASLSCSGSGGEEGTCLAPTCTDRVENGAETDVDCGGGSCDPCVPSAGCLEPRDCTSGVCTADVCQAPSCVDGVINGDETGLDCGGPTTEADPGCPRCPENQPCEANGDCLSGFCYDPAVHPPRDPAIEEKLCVEPTCDDEVINGDETDYDCGGLGGCDPCGDGDDCLVSTDCESGICHDESLMCVTAGCADDVQNGDETGTDCGGTCAADCADGLCCEDGDDCQSGVCGGEACPANPAWLTCQVPTCDDEVANGVETDVDCGGTSGCDPCEDGLDCVDNEDCESLVCNRTECLAAACNDGVQNGSETGEDCGGDDCLPCPVGGGCVVDEDCESAAFCLVGTCHRAASCLELRTERPATISGAYLLDPDGDTPGSFDPCRVYCDMVTAGGGWTLVASSRGSSSARPGTFDDKASVCYSDLGTDRPATDHSGVWEGMRALVPVGDTNSDIRFSCRSDVEDATFEVDLVFFDNDWYREITTGTDSHSCFSTPSEPFTAPARLNVITGDSAPASDTWPGGQLVGETSCEDLDTFAVSFNGPGSGAGYTATSWGEDFELVYDERTEEWVRDPYHRCGPLPLTSNAAYLVWVRETP